MLASLNNSQSNKRKQKIYEFQNSTHSCAFMPCSLKGCLINFISVTRSAWLMINSEAPLPVKTMWFFLLFRLFINLIISSGERYPSLVAIFISSRTISLYDSSLINLLATCQASLTNSSSLTLSCVSQVNPSPNACHEIFDDKI